MSMLQNTMWLLRKIIGEEENEIAKREATITSNSQWNGGQHHKQLARGRGQPPQAISKGRGHHNKQ